MRDVIETFRVRNIARGLAGRSGLWHGVYASPSAAKQCGRIRKDGYSIRCACNSYNVSLEGL